MVTEYSKNQTPAEMLTGLVLPGGWTVKELISKSKNATGGFFSQPYIVENKHGKEAFLKAIDYHRAFGDEGDNQQDVAKRIQEIVDTFNYEREILNVCKNRRLSKIVNAIDDGQIRIDPKDQFSVVQYIIFELANGDIRKHIKDWSAIDNAWTLRMLHNVAVGIKQLHGSKISHQDLKPSNVLVFDKNTSKIGDLGRSIAKEISSPHEGFLNAGDGFYAPPEALYGFYITNWEDRRFASDLYQFGSLIVFMFTGVNMTYLLQKNLDPSFRWNVWSEGYEKVLAYLQESYTEVIAEIKEVLNDEGVEDIDDLIKMIFELCNPDIMKRGHPKDIQRGGCQYSLERYSNILDRLAKKLEFKLKKAM